MQLPVSGWPPVEVGEGNVVPPMNGQIHGGRREKRAAPTEHQCGHCAKLGRTTEAWFMHMSSHDLFHVCTEQMRQAGFRRRRSEKLVEETSIL